MQIQGRQAMTDILQTKEVQVDQLVVAQSARGEALDELIELARHHDVPVRRVADRRIDQMVGDDRRHQGVVGEVTPPAPLSVAGFLASRTGRAWVTHVLLLDGVHNPANVGMLLRTAAAAGIDAVVLPRVGTAAMSALVVKAGSGVVFRVAHLDSATSEAALDEFVADGFDVVALDAAGTNLYDLDLPDRAVWVLGNESLGISEESMQRSTITASLPMSNNVESLNVAAAGAAVAFEVARRRSLG